MSRLRFTPFVPILLAGAALAQQTPPPAQQLPPDEDPAPKVQAPTKPLNLPPDEDAQTKPAAKPGAADTDLPPDEDAATVKTEYTFNPLKSKKAASAGDFYLHKGNFKAAAERYREATGWNEGNTEAWMKLGEAEEKRGQKKAARSAYEKYLQLAGNTKSAGEVKKRLEKLQ
jgi:tetratricopeptide (TPR) repeat protein